MRWPWVSAERLADAHEEIRRLRASNDGLLAALGTDSYTHERAMAAERERYAALVAHVIELKKLDYGPVPVVPPMPKTPVEPIPDAIRQNIARVSDPDTRERRQIEKRVRDLLASGVPVTEVATMVLNGEQVDDDL